MRSSVVVATLALAGCNDAVVVEIASDRPIPTSIDAICVGLADRALASPPFGQRYALEGALASLPQTLRVEPGDTDAAWAWVRADRGGVPIASAGALVDFTSDVVLSLDRCVRGPAGAPAVVGTAGPVAARLAASRGAGGVIVLALGATAEILDADGGALVASAGPELGGTVVDVATADLDGDCDDDAIVAIDGAPLALWRRDGRAFLAVAILDAAPVAAVAAADVDRDGDVDLITGGDATLALWRNDGGGNFTRDPAALAGAGRVARVRALVIGDLDGDGNPDLVVGQGGDPLVAWLGEPSGTGTFLPADAVVPPVRLDVARMHLADADGDHDPDLAVAVRGAAMRLYVDREGRLEDQSFVRLPQPAPVASAIAIGGWDPGCEPDAVIAGDGGSVALRGTPTGDFAGDGDAPPATDVVMADVDDDGDLDALVAGEDGVTWLAR